MSEYYKAGAERTDENERLLIPPFEQTYEELDDIMDYRRGELRDDGQNDDGTGESYAERNA